MQRFKRGDAICLFWQDRFGYPQMHYRPYVVVKRIHPTCYKVAIVTSDPTKSQVQWKTERRARMVHPSDMVPYDSDGVMAQHLRHLRDRWRKETAPEIIAAWEKEEAERRRTSEAINRRLRPIMARLFS